MRSKHLEGTNSRITEAEDKISEVEDTISEVEDRTVEINETEGKKKNKLKEMRTISEMSGTMLNTTTFESEKSQKKKTKRKTMRKHLRS